MDIPTELQSESLSPQPSTGLPMDATPAAFGAGVGQALEMGGEVATKLARDRQAEMDQVATQAAHNQLNAFTIETLYNPKTGVLSQNQGAEAPAATDQTLSEYRKTASKIRSGLSNDQQRETFDRITSDHGLQVRRELYAHEHQQVSRFANDQSAQAVQNAQTLAVQSARAGDMPGDAPGAWAKRVADQIATGNEALRQANIRNGLPADQGIAENTSQTHLGVISELLATDQTGTAKAYYDDNAIALDKNDAIRAASMVREGSDMSQARDIANDIIAKQHVDSVGPTGPEDQSKITREDALARLEKRGVTNVRVHDMAENRIEHFFHQKAEAHKEAQGQLVEQATKAIDDPANVNYAIPPNVLGQMDTREREAVIRYQTLMQKQGRIPTDEGTRLRLREAAANPDEWDAFVSEKPELYKGLLNKVDYREYENEVARIKGSIARRDDKLSQLQVSTQVAKTVMDENGLERPAGVKDSDPAFQVFAARRNKFMDQLNRAVQADALKLKRELTPDEIQEKGRQLFAQQSWVTTEDNPEGPQHASRFGAWLGQTIPHPAWLDHQATFTTEHTAPAFDTPGADKIAYSIKDIPPEELRKIVDSDNRKGVRRSDDERIADYNTLIRKAARAP